MLLSLDARRQLILGHVSGSRIFRAWRAGEETERAQEQDPTQLKVTIIEEGVELPLDANNDVVEIHYRDPNAELGEIVAPMVVFDQDLGHVLHVWSLNDIEAAVPSWDGATPVDLEGRILLKRTGTTITVPSDGSYLRWKTLVGLNEGGAVGSVNVYNIKDYGAVGDGVHNDTNAVRAAVTACQLAGGGVVYAPNGTYLISEHGNSLRCIELFSRVSLIGQSRAAIYKLAANQRTSVRMFYVTAGSVDLVIANLKLDGNRPGQTDQTGLFHNDAVFLDNTTRVRMVDVEIGFVAASPVVIFQNSQDIEIQHCYFHDSGWLAIALGDSAGQKNIAVRDCRLQGCAGGFHMESNGNPTPTDNVLIERSYMDATAGNASLQFVGGTGSTKWATNCVARDCQIAGYVLIAEAQNVLIQGCNITNADNAGTPHAAVRISGNGAEIVVANCFITQSAAGNAVQAVLIAGNNNNATSGVRVLDNTIVVQGTAQDGVFIQQGITSARIERNRILGNAGTVGVYGVHVNVKTTPTDGNIIIRGNHITDFPIGVGVESAAGSLHVNSLEVSENLFESITPSLMTAAMSLDLDNRHAVQQATCIGNELMGLTTMFATYPNVPVLVGGNRGGIAIYSCLGSPNTKITAPIGSIALQRDGVAGQVGWLNKDGTNTGWQKINLT